METPGYIALSRQLAMRREMDVIANNLANANTAGFQGDKMLFREHLMRVNAHETLRRAEKMSFVQDIGQVRDTKQGPLRFSGEELDIAIQGEGYLTVETPLGPRYTRNGRLQTNADGELVTPTGLKILGDNGQSLRIPQGSTLVKFNPNGLVEAQLPAVGGAFPVFQAVGRIQVVTFENQQEMRQSERGLFLGAGEAIPSQDARIAQGLVEESNVQPIFEITRMIDVTRSFASGNSMLESEHERQRKMIQMMGRSSANA